MTGWFCNRLFIVDSDAGYKSPAHISFAGKGQSEVIHQITAFPAFSVYIFYMDMSAEHRLKGALHRIAEPVVGDGVVRQRLPHLDELSHFFSGKTCFEQIDHDNHRQ